MSKFNFFLDIDGTILGKGQDFAALHQGEQDGPRQRRGRSMAIIPDFPAEVSCPGPALVFFGAKA